MKKIVSIFLFCLFIVSHSTLAQNQQVINDIKKEARKNSHLKELAHELMDVIGPRLVGTPQMKEAHEWAVEKFESWDISAENQQWGTWQGWERGITHIDMVSPRLRTLSGRMLAWSPGTGGDEVTAEVITLPEEVADSASFQEWLPKVEGKFVLTSMKQPSGRPDNNWEEWATDAELKEHKQRRKELRKNWYKKIKATGYSSRSLPKALEEAGAAGLISSNWSNGFGANKVFSAGTEDIPAVDMSLEDYGMLYRLAESDHEPEIRLEAQSEDLGEVPAFNTIATIEGTEKPDEYIILSAHYDSWDGATGATDNGTGSILMMETARILKKVYPNPKRTILVGLWGAEEEGLNGSRAFVEDHPEIVKNVQVLFNQDNGTGRVKNISGQGFLNSYDYISKWLSQVPDTVSQHIDTEFPGYPSSGGTDHASFVAAGAPAFNLSALSWSYWNYTWHTNLDTYDKIVFPEVENNVVLTAILTYMASEDSDRASWEKINLPINQKTGDRRTWPEQRSPNREGGN